MPGDEEHDRAEQPASEQPAYHLLVDDDERPVLRTALALLIDDVAHEGTIRKLAGSAIEQLDVDRAGKGALGEALTLTLAPGQLKVVHTAVRLLLDDLQRGQGDEMHVLQRLIQKLPDEHSIRAIELD